jgi:two-component system invasion response regulator UvrY
MIRILIIDDHSAIRNGVKHILSNEFDKIEFGEAEDLVIAFKKLVAEKWDMIILDINLKGRSGLDFLKDMKDNKIKTPVLVFSLHSEDQVALRAFKLGAFGYLSKDTADTELLKAVNKILSGGKYVTPSISEKMIARLENPSNKEPHELLSDREYQTLLLFAGGKTVSKIAEELSLSVPTISTYRTRILEKMNMKTIMEAASYAIKNNLI